MFWVGDCSIPFRALVLDGCKQGGFSGLHLRLDAQCIGKGVIEIDDELIWIDTFDKANNNLTVAPGFGRGFQGTTAAPHAQYAQVTLAPTFPRVSIKKAINDTINSYYPKLWAVSYTTFTFNASQTTYALPDDAEQILFMSWQTTGSSQRPGRTCWRRSRR